MKAIDFQPLGDNVIVRPIKLTEKGQFKRPQNEEDKAELGEIVAVPQEWEDLHVGDTVFFNKYSSTAMDMGPELIVRVEDIVAVLKKKK